MTTNGDGEDREVILSCEQVCKEFGLDPDDCCDSCHFGPGDPEQDWHEMGELKLPDGRVAFLCNPQHFTLRAKLGL